MEYLGMLHRFFHFPPLHGIVRVRCHLVFHVGCHEGFYVIVLGKRTVMFIEVIIPQRLGKVLHGAYQGKTAALLSQRINGAGIQEG